jgi:hypothetical protein
MGTRSSGVLSGNFLEESHIIHSKGGRMIHIYKAKRIGTVALGLEIETTTIYSAQQNCST